MRIIHASALLSLLLASAVAHGDDKYDAAESLAKSGDIAGMAAVYRQILDADSADTKARLAYARALSWQGQYQAAEEQFSTLLKQEPGHLEAMKGLGYNYAWSDQFDLAEQQFKAALEIAPDNFGVQKGLAFTYLWSDRPSQALEVFQALQEQHPDDLEILAAIESAEVGLIDCVYYHDHV